MLKYLLPISGMVSLLLLFGCQKEETVDRDYPRIRTAAVNEITDQGATFNATVLSGSMENVDEYGFVWGNTDNLSLENSEKIIVNETPENSGFSCDITFALDAMKKYFVRAYVKAGEKVIYGDIVQFMSLGSQAPQIEDYFPKSGVWGDTITITGTNFSYQNLHMVVYVGDKMAPVVQSTNERIKALVPSSLDKNDSQVYVEIFGNRSTAQELFHLNTPAYITSVTNALAIWGDTLIITGVFPYSTHNLSFTINNTIAPILVNGTSTMKIQVPNNLNFSDSMLVKIFVDGHGLKAPRGIKFEVPRIDQVAPAVYGWLDTITLKGLFHSVSSFNKVFMGNISAIVVSSKASEIRCIIPETLEGQTATLSVTINGKVLQYTGGLSLSGPLLTAVVPNVARSSEVIRLKGKYFKDGHTTVIINGSTRAFNFINSKELETSAPTVYANGPVPVQVIVYKKEVTRNDIFSIQNPEITDFSPKRATFGDIITVTGIGFNPGNMDVRICGAAPEIIEETPTLIRFKVPNNISNSGLIQLYLSGTEVNSKESFFLKSPVITSVSSPSGKEGDHITIYGNFFNPEQQYEQVYFRSSLGLDAQAKILSGTTTQIEVEVPSLLQDSYSIWVNVNYSTYFFPEKFTVSSPWKRVDFNLQGSHCYGTTVYVHHTNANFTGYLDQVYLLGGFNIYGAFQLVDFSDHSTSFFNNVPYTDQDIGGCAFTCNGNIFYLPSDDYNIRTQYVHTYNVLYNQWVTLAQPFPGPGRRFALSFSVDDSLGFILGGSNTQALGDFWIYHGITATWEGLHNYPGGSCVAGTAVVSSGYAYILDRNQFWRYHPATNTWTGLKPFPGPTRIRATGFAVGGKIYFGTGTSGIIFDYNSNETAYKDLWEYNPVTDSWKQVSDLPGGPRNGAFGFELNGKGYIGGGSIISYDGQTDIYEYDPSYE